MKAAISAAGCLGGLVPPCKTPGVNAGHAAIFPSIGGGRLAKSRSRPLPLARDTSFFFINFHSKKNLGTGFAGLG